MKVEVWYQPDGEYVEAEVTWEEIENALLGKSADSGARARSLIGAAHTALKGIPQVIIDEMNEGSRKNVAEALRAQAERYEMRKEDA